jgi:hypothetical protein
VKRKLFLLVVAVTVALCSCATKIPFEQTCLTCVQSQRLNCSGENCPETIVVDGNCLVLIDETGEKINLNHILAEENILIQKGIPVTVAKIRGRYFVIGKDFKNLWILTPVENTAKVKNVLLPEANLSLPPVFEITNGNLLVRGTKDEYSYIYDIDENTWNRNYSKAGE